MRCETLDFQDAGVKLLGDVLRDLAWRWEDYRSFCEDRERRQKLQDKREETEVLTSVIKEELGNVTQSLQANVLTGPSPGKPQRTHPPNPRITYPLPPPPLPQ